MLFYINRMLRKHGTIKILFLSCFLMGIRILLPIRSGIIGIVLAQLLQGVTYMTKNDMLSRRLETGEQIRITRGYKK